MPIDRVAKFVGPGIAPVSQALLQGFRHIARKSSGVIEILAQPLVENLPVQMREAVRQDLKALQGFAGQHLGVNVSMDIQQLRAGQTLMRGAVSATR